MHPGSHTHGLHEHRHTSHVASGVLSLALAATVALVTVEFLAAYWGRSMALAGDAVHNLTDIPTLAISWLAVRWARRPPDREKTFGYHRTGILSAFVNAILMMLVAVCILYESVQRLRQPVSVNSGLMIWISVVALGVNGGITLSLMRSGRDLNLRAILIHNFGDSLSNVAILAGALAIREWGAGWVDPALGIGIGALVLWSAGGVLRESTHILLEGLPRGIRLEDVAQTLLHVEGVQEVHDIHIWTLGTDLEALSCHVRIPDMHMEESEKILARIQERLARDFAITHTTIQFERAGLPVKSGYYMPEPAGPSRKP